MSENNEIWYSVKVETFFGDYIFAYFMEIKMPTEIKIQEDKIGVFLLSILLIFEC